MIKPFPHYQQLDSMDCGPSCLRMIAKYYGRSYSLQNLRERSFITRQGVSMLGISDEREVYVSVWNSLLKMSLCPVSSIGTKIILWYYMA